MRSICSHVNSVSMNYLLEQKACESRMEGQMKCRSSEERSGCALKRVKSWPLLLIVGLMALALPVGARQRSTILSKVDFNREVLPLLSAHCFQCHGGGQNQGGLSLDSRTLVLKGGASGPSLVPGKSGKSLLIARMLGQGGKSRMPLGFAPLSVPQIRLIRTWIDQGAFWQAGSGLKPHWAYIRPARSRVPRVRHQNWVRNAIDAFVLSRLERAGIPPSPEVDKVTLLRRVTLDLTGLPPSPQEVDAFLADRRPNAYGNVVDRLLASPHYGERMALPWLDTARYADSNGFQQDGDTFQYVWRDWVVRAMNANMPFDQFTIQQLAGDLLPHATLDQKVATGFNRCHLLNGEGGAIPEEQRHVILFDRVDVTATAWMGATLACAQCHNHKYDPFTQKDYYAFMAYFNQVPETGTPSGSGQYRIADPWIYVGTAEENAKLGQFETRIAAAKSALAAYNVQHEPEMRAAQAQWEANLLKSSPPKKELSAEILAILRTRPEMRTTAAATQLRNYFLTHSPPPAFKTAQEQVEALTKQREELQGSVPRVMIMSDAQPRKTHLLNRGNYEMPGPEVTAATPGFLPAPPAGAPQNRLGLAQWLVSPQNPLTARVQVNRYWQLFFGTGLVKTSENLGIQCETPSHPELLDWLAAEFRESGWNVKRLHRLIVTSSTYRQSAKVSPALRRRDPENRLLARAARFRMPSLLLRDVALASSGLLNRQIGGKPVYPYQPKGIWDGLAITHERDFTYPQSKGPDLYRRSLYTFWRRTVAPANLFDASVRTTCKVRLSVTSTPLHALTTLNDVTWVEAGRVLAEHVMKEAGRNPNARLIEAFRRICARRPDLRERKILRRCLDRALTNFHDDRASATAYLKQGDSPSDPALDPVEHAAYASVCLAIYNLDEALTRE